MFDGVVTVTELGDVIEGTTDGGNKLLTELMIGEVCARETELDTIGPD